MTAALFFYVCFCVFNCVLAWWTLVMCVVSDVAGGCTQELHTCSQAIHCCCESDAGPAQIKYESAVCVTVQFVSASAVLLCVHFMINYHHCGLIIKWFRVVLQVVYVCVCSPIAVIRVSG